MRGAAAQAGREGRDPDGGARPLRVVRELRSAVSHLGRDRRRIEPARRERADVSRHVQDRRADELRGGLDLAEEEDRGPAQRRDRRGDEGVLRQAGALARRALGAPAASRYRLARNLPGANGAGRPEDPRVDGTRHRVPDGHVQLLGHAVRQARAPCRGDRRRVHRTRDRGEPDPCRIRGDAGRDARSAPRSARSRARPARRGAREKAWPAPRTRRRRGRLQAARKRRARSADEVGQGVPGGHRCPRARRASRHGACQDRGTQDRRTRRHSGRREHAHERPGHLRRRRCGRGQGFRHRASGASSRWQVPRTGRDASRPT